MKKKQSKSRSIILLIALLVSIAQAVPMAHAEIWPSDQIFTKEEEGNATFRVSPNVSAEYGGIIYMVVVPDKETNLGMGPGASITLKAVAVDGRWEVSKVYLYGGTQGFWDGFTVPANAQNDDKIEGTHISKIQIGYRCDTDMSRYPPHKTRFTVTNTITDNDTEGDIRGAPNNVPDYEPPCLYPEIAGSLNEKTPEAPTNTAPQKSTNSNKPSNSSDQAPKEETKGFLLNESKAFVDGTGETLWLKVGEGARFNLSKAGKVEEHSVTVESVGDTSAGIIIASDPIKATLQKDMPQAFDANKDGTNDIEITFVGVSEGQAGLLFRPVSEAVKIAAPKGRIASADSQPQKSKRNYAPYITGVAVVAVIAGGLVYLKRRKKMTATEATKKSK